MGNDFEHLESLARLSRETSSEGRQELLREVTDMFLDSPEGNLSEKEVQYFGDIMGRLAFEMEMKVRQHLAETLSAVNHAPPDLISKLANDEIEVARPVLMKSGVLQDADLLKIVKARGQEYLQAVSMRETVSEQIADAIVEKGNDTVLGVLASNAGAEISENAIETMVTRSEDGDGALQEALVKRQDIPPELLKKMYNHVSQALRDHILATGAGIDESQVDGLMAETQEWFESEEAAQGVSEAEKFIIRKEKLHQLDPKLLLKLVRDGKLPEFIAGVSRLCKIDLATARQAVFDESGEKLAVVCKSLEVDTEMFSQFVDCLDTENKRDEGDRGILVGVYSRITALAAQRAMRFLRTRQKLKKDEALGKSWGV